MSLPLFVLGWRAPPCLCNAWPVHSVMAHGGCAGGTWQQYVPVPEASLVSRPKRALCACASTTPVAGRQSSKPYLRVLGLLPCSPASMHGCLEPLCNVQCAPCTPFGKSDAIAWPLMGVTSIMGKYARCACVLNAARDSCLTGVASVHHTMRILHCTALAARTAVTGAAPIPFRTTSLHDMIWSSSDTLCITAAWHSTQPLTR